MVSLYTNIPPFLSHFGAASKDNKKKNAAQVAAAALCMQMWKLGTREGKLKCEVKRKCARAPHGLNDGGLAVLEVLRNGNSEVCFKHNSVKEHSVGSYLTKSRVLLFRKYLGPLDPLVMIPLPAHSHTTEIGYLN